jgi:hypothetical protein
MNNQKQQTNDEKNNNNIKGFRQPIKMINSPRGIVNANLENIMQHSPRNEVNNLKKPIKMKRNE